MAKGPAVLVELDDKGVGRQYFVNEECVLGRLPECQIQLIDSQISKRHARIFLGASGERGDQYQVEDLGSLNGVLLNGQRVLQSSALSSNDLITVGSHHFLFNPNLQILPEMDSDRAVVLLDDQATASAQISSFPGAGAGAGSLPAELLSELLAVVSESKGSVLHDMLACLKSWLDYDSAAVLMTSEGRTLDPICIVSDAQTLTISRSIAQMVLVQKKAIRLPDAIGDPVLRKGKSVVSGKLRSVLVVPLWLKHDVVGVLFFCKNRPDFYSDADLQKLVHAAPVMAVAALQRTRLASLQQQLSHHIERISLPEEMMGQSAPLEQLKKTIKKVAPTPAPVLIIGETGTGKELVAQWLHVLGPGPSQPFVVVNCGALPETLAESEFFGHEKGAFSGADRMKPGKLELARGGTLFLDEIGELSLALQVKLLRVLEQKSFYRLGGTKTMEADFRLVAATHRDLKAMCQQGTFREDLYYRIHVIHLEVLPLHERPDDIEPLTKYFLDKFSREFARDVRGIDRQVLNRFKAYSWPGNIRELRNVVERMVVLAEEQVLSSQHLPMELAVTKASSKEGGLASRIELLERQLITQAVKDSKHNKSAAARMLGISRPTLDKKLVEYNIDL